MFNCYYCFGSVLMNMYRMLSLSFHLALHLAYFLSLVPSFRFFGSGRDLLLNSNIM